MCLEACPTYRLFKNEADSPRGRIALLRGIADGRIPMTQTVLLHLDACLDCRACETACPAGVPYGELIEEGRAELYARVSGFARREWLKRFLLTQILAKPKRLNLLAKMLKFYQMSGLQSFARKSKILKFFPAWIVKGEAILPEIQPESRSHRSRQPKEPKARVALFKGCIASVLFPHVEEAALKTLQTLGCAVSTPEKQICCGALLSHSGFKSETQTLAKKNIAAFFEEEFDFIVTTAAGCGSTLKEYSRFLPEDSNAANFSKKILDYSEAICRIGIPDALKSLPLRVAYQDACHLLHAQKIKTEPRKILKAIPQLDLVELPHSDWCCGSAGIYNLTHPQTAQELLEQKIKTILSVSPDAVAVGNPGCALQIRMGLRAAGSSIPVLHPAELLDKSLS